MCWVVALQSQTQNVVNDDTIDRAIATEEGLCSVSCTALKSPIVSIFANYSIPDLTLNVSAILNRFIELLLATKYTFLDGLKVCCLTIIPICILVQTLTVSLCQLPLRARFAFKVHLHTASLSVNWCNRCGVLNRCVVISS